MSLTQDEQDVIDEFTDIYVRNRTWYMVVSIFVIFLNVAILALLLVHAWRPELCLAGIGG